MAAALDLRAQLTLRGLRDGDRRGDEPRVAGRELRLPAGAARHPRAGRRDPGAAGGRRRPRRRAARADRRPGSAAHARRGGAAAVRGTSTSQRSGRNSRGCWLPSVRLDERVERQTRGLRAHGRHRRTARGRTAVGTAVVLATALASDGRPAALLPWEGGTVLSRLTGQLAELGVRRPIVLARPAFAAAVHDALGPAAEVRASASRRRRPARDRSRRDRPRRRRARHVRRHRHPHAPRSRD